MRGPEHAILRSTKSIEKLGRELDRVIDRGADFASSPKLIFMRVKSAQATMR